jgi:hypothetical protein
MLPSLSELDIYQVAIELMKEIQALMERLPQ